MLKPGSTIGILGGGQLGRMLALSAARLGLHCHIYSPEKDSGAFEVVRASTCAAYEDEAALAKFAASVDVITYEFENVPAKTAAFLAKRKPVFPDPHVLELTQDRLIEKNFIDGLKIAVAPYAAVHSASQLAAGLEHLAHVVQKRRLDQPLVLVPPLGPRVGKHHMHHLGRRAGQQVPHEVVALHPDQPGVGGSRPGEPAAGAPHAAQEAFHPEEIALRGALCHRHQERAVARAEVQFQRRAGALREDGGEIERHEIIVGNELRRLGRKLENGLHGCILILPFGGMGASPS